MPNKRVCIDDFIVTLKIKTQKVEEPKDPVFRTFNSDNKSKQKNVPVCAKCQRSTKKRPCRRCITRPGCPKCHTH